MIIVDEASRVHEVDVIALVGKYPSALSKILCGDSLQLPPTVVHRGDLSAQYGVPLQTRLTANGTPAALLTTKYRMDPEIMAILNKVAYNGKLVAHESTMDLYAARAFIEPQK